VAVQRWKLSIPRENADSSRKSSNAEGGLLMHATESPFLYAEHAEKTILGAMLLEDSAFIEADTLEPSDMYLDSHRKLLTVMRTMRAGDAAVDLVTLCEELNRRHEMDAVGGIGYVNDLTYGIPRKLNIHSYVKVVKEKAALRSVISLCNVAIARAEDGQSSLEILGDLQSGALAYQAVSDELRAQHISELVVPFWNEITLQMAATNKVLGIPTGISELDESTSGWRDGELTFVGAKPGMGKTSYMLQCMYNAANAGYPVGCISLEMRSNQLMKRLAIMESGIHAGIWRDPRDIPVADRPHARTSAFSLGDLPIWISDQSGLNPRQISALARKMHANGARMIYIDFIQIIEEMGRDRREAINRVSSAIRDTCKALGIPFVVLSQLARGDKDSNRKPTKEDLRESGNLEQDAHNVQLLWREKNENGLWTGNDLIIIDKAREGEIGHIEVSYDPRSLTYKPRFQS
jgi:replicative DNA helicase